MDVVGAEFDGLVETERFGINMVPRTRIDMMGTLMVGLAINHEEALVRVRQAIEGEEGDLSEREGMVVVTMVSMQVERSTSVHLVPSQDLQYDYLFGITQGWKSPHFERHLVELSNNIALKSVSYLRPTFRG